MLPDVTEEVRSEDTLRAAFEKRLPQIAPDDLTAPLELPGDDDWAAQEAFTLFVRACVEALFPDVPAEVPCTFLSWNPVQRALLTELAKLPAAVLINAGDLSDRILRVGAMSMVSGDERYLLRYVGLVAPGPLEQEVEGRPLWLWLRLHLMGRVTREAWQAATATLEDGARLELSRLAVNNAYQLLRRWPFPTGITPTQENEDTASLFDGVLSVLQPLSDRAARETVRAEVGKPYPDGAMLLLLSLLLLEREAGLPGHEADIAEACEAALTRAVELYPTHGRRLLLALAPERRSSLMSRMEPVPHNVRGFWTHVELIDAAERSALVTAALSGFKRTCSPPVAARVKELVRGFGREQRAGLRAVAAGKGPNALLVAEALAQLD